MYLQQNWVPWLFAVIGAALGYIIKKMKNQQRESRAIAKGVQSLLRENMVHNYNKYQERILSDIRQRIYQACLYGIP